MRVIVIWWLAMNQIAWSVAERTGGYGAAEDMIPYGNAHLIEEAFQGLYSPVRDPRFLLGCVLPTALAFAVSGFWCARASWRTAAPVGAGGVMLLALLYQDVVAGYLPGSFRTAFALELGIGLVAMALGTTAGSLFFLRRPPLPRPAGT